MIAVDPVSAVQEFVEAIRLREVDRAIDLLGPEPVLEAPQLFGPPMVGRPMIRRVLIEYFHAVPDLKLVLLESYASGAEVVGVIDVQGTMAQVNPNPAFFSVWSPGRQFRWRGALRFEVASDGRIGAIKILGDPDAARVQPRYDAPLAGILHHP